MTQQEPHAQRQQLRPEQVPIILTTLIVSGVSPATRGSKNWRSRGATMADEPARMTIKPTETGTFPLAIAVRGGP